MGPNVATWKRSLIDAVTGIQALDLLGRKMLLNFRGKKSNDFYTAKIQTAEFYFARLLPRAESRVPGRL